MENICRGDPSTKNTLGLIHLPKCCCLALPQVYQLYATCTGLADTSQSYQKPHALLEWGPEARRGGFKHLQRQGHLGLSKLVIIHLS